MIRALRMGTPLVLALIGCKGGNGAELVGDKCRPEKLPSSLAGSGFMPGETYLTEADVCEGHPCLVNRLDNHSDGGVLADPNVLCEGSDPAPGCVTPQQVEQSVHCSCECEGPGSRDNKCECPNDYACSLLFTLREDGLRNGPRGYCVRRR